MKTSATQDPESSSSDERPSPANPIQAIRRQLVKSVILNLIAPVVVYLLIRPHVPNDTVALALVGAIPVVVTAVVFLRRRRIEPIAMLATIGFVIAVGISLLWGGGSLPLKLHEAVITGACGLACLVSVLIGKPLHLMLVGRLLGQAGAPPDDQVQRRSSVMTLIFGCTLVLHTAVHTAVALTLSTSAFLVVSRISTVVIYGLGAVTLLLYIRSTRTPAKTDQAP
jgi:hypothetical protein